MSCYGVSNKLKNSSYKGKIYMRFAILVFEAQRWDLRKEKRKSQICMKFSELIKGVHIIPRRNHVFRSFCFITISYKPKFQLHRCLFFKNYKLSKAQVYYKYCQLPYQFDTIALYKLSNLAELDLYITFLHSDVVFKPLP